jgi:hypothetical protein
VQLQRSDSVSCELWSLSLGIERCCGLQGAVVFVVCWGWGFGYVSALNLYRRRTKLETQALVL